MSKKRKNSPGKSLQAIPQTETPDDTDFRNRLFKENYDELVKKQISNSENFDRSILTLSTSGLGISLAFIKDFVPLATAEVKTCLMLSWVLFAVAIISTMGSFLTSQKAITTQIDYSHKYYLERKDEYLALANPYSAATSRLNFAAGAAFIFAIFLTIFFSVYNLIK
jgi:hypothetical protein